MRTVALALLFLLLSVIAISRAPGPDALLFSLDNDSVMRLVMIRDLLNGQDWFDLSQVRLGVDGGSEMHWSRLLDGLLAALISGGGLVFGPLLSEYWVMMLWPLAMLGLAMIIVFWIGRALDGPGTGAFAAALVGLSLVTTARFAPGGIDHHNIQLVLLLTVVMGLVVRRVYPGWAMVSGFALAVSLVIGVETFPLLALCGLAMAVFWVVDGGGERTAALRFSTSIIAGLLVLFPLTAPASAWQGGFCDGISIDLVVVAGGTAVGLALAAAMVVRGDWVTRLTVVAGVGVVCCVVALLYAPACLSNPLASLDPYLKSRWLDIVSEARSFSDVVSGSHKDRFYLGFFCLGVVAVGAAVHIFRRGPNRLEWAFLSVLIVLATALTAYQLRSYLTIVVLSAPPIAAVVARLSKAGGSGVGRWRAIAAPTVFALAVPLTWAAGLSLVDPDAGSDPAIAASSGEAIVRDECLVPGVFDSLADQPPGLVSAVSNMGAEILAFTPHRVLAAPYHRNQAGMRAQLEIALASNAEEARAHMQAVGVDYVVVCASDPEMRALEKLGYSGFLRELEQGVVPEFLTPIPVSEPESPLRIYKFQSKQPEA